VDGRPLVDVLAGKKLELGGWEESWIFLMALPI